MSGLVPLPEENLIRYRIMHSDKELRPLAKRLHRYAASSSTLPTSDTDNDDDKSHERDMIRMEMLKWKMQIERMLGSVKNLDRQRETYIKRAEETVNKTDSLRQTLEEEKVMLATRRRERDRMIKCDEVAAKVNARGKNRQELDERIAAVQQTLEEHKAALKVYQETAEGRVQIFNKIHELVRECRDLKLPIDPNATIPIEEEEKTETDIKEGASAITSMSATVSGSGSNAPKLSSMALPFQPKPNVPSNSNNNLNRGAKSRSSTPPASASLPARPPNGASSSSSRIPTAPSRGNANLPNRPSQLRSSSTAAGRGNGGSLEEGELGGDEDGEVKERGTKRAMEPERSSRSTRSRK